MSLSMEESLRSFNDQITVEIRDVGPPQVQALTTKITSDALRRLVTKTPVLTGKARGGWQVTIGAPFVGQTGRFDFSGIFGNGDSVVEGNLIIASAPPFSKLYITNNVPYIGELERGSSAQAPSGFFRVTFEELRAIYE